MSLSHVFTNYESTNSRKKITKFSLLFRTAKGLLFFNKKLYWIILLTYSDLNKKNFYHLEKENKENFVKTCDELVHSLEVAVLVSKGIDPVPH